MINRKSTRLPNCNYVGRATYFLTICCAHRLPHLNDPAVASAILKTLLYFASTKAFAIHAYCLMPDHIHILAEGTHSDSDALGFVRSFKQQTAFHFKKKTAQILWEFSHYDHILRARDNFVEVSRYIWWNPVCKKLSRAPDSL